ncbi:AIC_G0013780.mRNA.1.CDS.1 [Saccharomyces cerevisiae]|nr:hexose transporter HXT13 [Saccharomyces cerevisiae]CAI4397052.1 CAS_1a_G0013720.mRNA.1.CDS.1 [Saccharomyces cerevisiae]CAI4401098.1 AIC_G0013780.mRNA.1.CDS.1 [Saccharomyces cerevisiae]CAI4407491.1 AFI_G0013760.mRNA.1.CDS.1 [Saccharomyces cerevisiae]CAI6613738.1 AIC_G0013780.mRNA.1.CDS.1 [Saccharomyces cerevisiae]
MSSAQSSIDSDGDIRDADIHVAPPVEKEWSDGFDDNEVINGDNVEPPKRGLIGYLVIYLLCYPISFGGFLPGWDSGITAGFINMDNFKMNFGSYKHSTGEYYLSNVRMGLLVATAFSFFFLPGLFTISC